MKKIYTILILLLVLSLSVSAQNPFNTKKTSKRQRSEFRSSNSKTINLHPFPSALPDSVIRYNKYGDIDHRSTFAYDDQGRIVETNYSDHGDLFENHRIPFSQTIYTLDSEGRITEEEDAYVWNQETQEWEERYKNVYVYYKGDKPLQSGEYRFNSENGEWTLDEKAFYQFDDKDNVISYTIYVDRDSDGIEEVLEIARCEYTIDIEGYLNYLVEITRSDYELILKSKIQYNDQHYLIYDETYECMNNQWYGGYKTITVYENGKLASKEWSYTEDAIEVDWHLEEVTVYTYDQDGNILKKEDLYENETTPWYTTIYYYPSKSNIESDKANNDVKVSLVNGVLTVDNNQAESISVYSITGAQIATFVKDEGKASTSINANGVVIIKGSSGWAAKAISK